MSWLCPTCREPLDPATLTCAGGHRLAWRDGVPALVEEAFGRWLDDFLAGVGAARAAAGQRLLDSAAYPGLPFGPATRGRHEWRLRRYDLALIGRRLAGRRGLRVLDVGAWNGWLSHRLAAWGHDVTAVDYFTDPYDGLGARRFYPTNWRAAQLDLTDLSLLNQDYDLVIVNRCLAFFPDPLALVATARRHLAPDGQLILTGLQVFHRPAVKARQVAALRQAHQARFGRDLFLRPTKGYLDGADLTRLRAAGVAIHHDPHLWLANLKSLLNPSLPRHAYGLGAKAGEAVGT